MYWFGFKFATLTNFCWEYKILNDFFPKITKASKELNDFFWKKKKKEYTDLLSLGTCDF